MELVQRTIKLAGSGKPVYVCLLGDIQWSGKEGPTAKDSLQRFLDRALELDAYFIGMGDYIDFMSPSNRQRLKAAALYDTAEDVIDAKALDLVHELYDAFLRPTKGRWLGLLEGHHFVELRTGDTTDIRLCQWLDAPFLGSMAYVNLAMRAHTTTYYHTTFWVTHGTGSGRTPAAMLNKLREAAAYWQRADIYAAGHCTRLSVDRIQRPYPIWNHHSKDKHKLKHTDAVLLVTGGFMASFKQGSKVGRIPRGSYAERGMMNPSALAAPIIELTPWRAPDEGGGRDTQVEIKVIA